MLWRGNDQFPGSRDLFTGGLFDTSYGPPPGFNWGGGFGDNPIVDNEHRQDYNVEERVADFMEQG